MTKFTPTLSDRKYNLKLVAIVGGTTNVYAYVDDDGDQMLVRSFDDDTRIPYVEASLALRLNPKTGRMYTVITTLHGPGTKQNFREVDIPESWKRGDVVSGASLGRVIEDCVNQAIFAIKYVDDAADDLEDIMQMKTHDDGYRLSRKSRERATEKAEEEASESYNKVLTDDIEKLYGILGDID